MNGLAPRAATEAQIRAWIGDFGPHVKLIRKLTDTVFCDDGVTRIDAEPEYLPSKYGGAGKLRLQTLWACDDPRGTGRLTVDFHGAFFEIEAATLRHQVTYRSTSFDLDELGDSLRSILDLVRLSYSEGEVVLADIEIAIAHGQAIRDGETIWWKCGPDCDLHVVRPGKVQCSCEPAP